MTRNDYIDLFNTASDAIEFEAQALSIGDEFLPEGARAVRDGGEPSSEYWSWLATQVHDGLVAEPAEPETVAQECLRGHFDGARSAWREGNDAGCGYGIGDDDQSPEEGIEAEGWELLYRRQNDQDVAVARNEDGRLVAVGDAHGPWAVDLF